MIFQIAVTLFLGFMFFMLYSSRHAYVLRFPVLVVIIVGFLCVWHVEAAISVAHFLGIGRAPDLVFACCILLSFYCFFTLYLRQERIKENITELTRKMAVDNALPPVKTEDVCQPIIQEM